MKTKTPTLEVYEELQQAYDHFNEGPFAAELPTCLVTLQREKTSLGYFSYQRFVNVAGQRTDEIATKISCFRGLPGEGM